MRTPFLPNISQRVVTSIASAANAIAGGTVIRLANTSSTAAEIVYARFGDATVVATNADIALPAGSIELFSRPNGATHVALIAASGTPAVNIVSGEGL